MKVRERMALYGAETCRKDMLDAFKEAIFECDLQDRVYLVNCHK